MGRSKDNRLFQKNFYLFFHTLILHLDATQRLYPDSAKEGMDRGNRDDDEPPATLLDILTDWLTLLTGATHRPLRVTATLAALKIMQSLCACYAKHTKAETATDRLYQAALANRAGLHSKRAETLKDKLAMLRDMKKTLASYLEHLYHGFVQGQAIAFESLTLSSAFL